MTERISPMYRRLPHGPHQLSRGAVARHQRIRIHGAMIEAIARHGYEGTTVRHLVGLAGVSRRCFYEQFANKEDCFLATFDLLAGRGVQRMSGAYAAADGDLEDRLGAAFGQLAEVAATRRKATRLVLVDALTAGPGALLRLRSATGTCERLLSRCFAESPGATPLPAPLVRAIAGGLQCAMSRRVREQIDDGGRGIAEEMLRWTLHFHASAAQRLSERMAERVVRRLRASATVTARHGAAATSSADPRERLLRNALRLAVLDDYGRLTAAQIADGASVSMDLFFELFADKDECFLAALEMLGEELLAIAADPDLTSADWPFAVRRVTAELMRFLAQHPLYARTIAQEAFTAGPVAAGRNLELAHALARLLTQGAPSGAQSRLLVEGLAGALWHTVRCHVAGGRIELLPALSDHLAYVALAPSIGAEAAAQILSREEFR
jgi:AcrR family transcriptional regulator